MSENDIRTITSQLTRIEEKIDALKNKIDWINANLNSVKMVVDNLYSR